MQEFKVGDYVKYVGELSTNQDRGYVTKVEPDRVWVLFETGCDSGSTLYCEPHCLKLILRPILRPNQTEVTNEEVKLALDTLIKAGYTVTLSERR